MAPIAWLAYNEAVYGNALAFANGPYSARAIEARVGAPNPAAHNLVAAACYFLKSAQINLAVGNWGRFWLLTAVVATAVLAWRLKTQASSTILILLWSPVVFYSLSIAYGSVPLHVPMWWPFAIFNQRFGLELMPMFAVSAGALVAVISSQWPALNKWKAGPAAAAVLILGSYMFVWIAKPVCWLEAERNWDMRRGLDTAVELAIKELPPNSTFLMDLGEHVGIMERLGIPLRRVVNNEDHRPWARPADPEGLWELRAGQSRPICELCDRVRGRCRGQECESRRPNSARGNSLFRTAAGAYLSNCAAYESIALTAWESFAE